MAEDVLVAVRFPLTLIGTAAMGEYLFAGGAFVSRGSVPVCTVPAMSAGNLLSRLAMELTILIWTDWPVWLKIGANAEQFIEGVSLVTVSSVTETAPLLVTLARHLQDGLGYEVPLRVAKPKNLSDLAQYLVEGLPGIGPSTAKVLLAHFGSAELVFGADVESLCKVPGVGKKTAKRIREALACRM